MFCSELDSSWHFAFVTIQSAGSDPLLRDSNNHTIFCTNSTSNTNSPRRYPQRTHTPFVAGRFWTLGHINGVRIAISYLSSFLEPHICMTCRNCKRWPCASLSCRSHLRHGWQVRMSQRSQGWGRRLSKYQRWHHPCLSKLLPRSFCLVKVLRKILRTALLVTDAHNDVGCSFKFLVCEFVMSLQKSIFALANDY